MSPSGTHSALRFMRMFGQRREHSKTECDICGSQSDLLKDKDVFGDPVLYCGLCRATGFAAQAKSSSNHDLTERSVTPIEFAKAIHWMRDTLANELREALPKPKAIHTNAITGHT